MVGDASGLLWGAKMKYIYSKSQNAFYPFSLRELYELTGTWPSDGVEVSMEVFETYTSTPPVGKHRVTGVDGLPAWEDIPLPTKEQVVSMMENEKKSKINYANDFINNKQWQGKAAVGRLNNDGLLQYNIWLDYLDALEAIDTSSAPDIEWPTPPVYPAS